MMLALWAAVTFLGVLERRLHDPLGAEDRDRLDRDARLLACGRVELVCQEAAQLLDLFRPLLELDACVEVLGVLAHDDEVRVGKSRAHPLVGLAGPDARVEVELLAQGDVDRAVARADRGGGRALDGDAPLADRGERSIRERVALLLVHVDARVLEVPVELDARGLEYSPGRLRELRPGAVARDEGDAVCQEGPFVIDPRALGRAERLRLGRRILPMQGRPEPG
jgi:hypothetical protein